MRLFPLTAIVALVGSVSSHAAIVQYTDRASFLAALGTSHATTNFSSLPAGDQGVSSITAFDAPGITVVLETLDADGFAGNPFWVATAGNIAHAPGASTSYTDSIRISIPGGLLAIGANWFLGDIEDNHLPGTVQLTFSDGSIFDVASTSQGNAFAGFISDTPITSVVVAPTDPANVAGWVTVDNLTIPEPSSTLLGGLAAILTLSRRRRSRGH